MPAPVTMKSDTVNLAEIFSSIQGEGCFIGKRQVFIRFTGCNLSCEYCDTEQNDPPEYCRMESTPGRRDFIEVPNPVAMGKVLDLLKRWKSGWPTAHHSISLTGGEPLLHVDLLGEWIDPLKKILPLYLETNGVLHYALLKVVRDMAHVSMDIKLPSSSGEDSLWSDHMEFLRIASETDLSVKTVVSASTEPWELIRAAEMTASVSPRIPFIIQPETSDDLSLRISNTALLELQEIAARFLKDVRVIPQTHRFMGML